MSQSKSRITAIGTYVPERILTNADLEKMVETSDEWIVQRTGMRERRIAAPDQYVSDLAIKAVEDMVERYGVTVQDADMILVATSTPEYSFPSTASRVQSKLGIASTGAMDLNAACAGFVYALQMADGLISGEPTVKFWLSARKRYRRLRITPTERHAYCLGMAQVPYCWRETSLRLGSSLPSRALLAKAAFICIKPRSPSKWTVRN